YRGDPAIDAAARALALRMDARAGNARGGALHRLPAGEGLDRMTGIASPDPRVLHADVDALRESRIDGAQVYRGALLDVRRDRARLPDGHEAVREYIVHPGAVLVVPIDDDG